MMTSESVNSKPENPFLNILANIVFPIIVLNNGHKFGISSLLTLFIALSFPLIYGIIDYNKRRKANFVSLLGLLNVLITGGFAVLNLEGHWFWYKEAAFPLLVGFFVAVSSKTKNPFMKAIFLNPQMVQVELLHQKLNEKNTEAQFEKILHQYSLYLSFSFFVSALANYLLARTIFTPISSELVGEARTLVLNQQLAQMTKYSMIVLLLPSMLFMLGLVYSLMKKLTQLTGLSTEEIFKN